MPEPTGAREANNAFLSQPFGFFADALLGDDSGDTPLTHVVLGIMLGIFLVQVVIMVRYQVEEPVLVAYGFFKNLTWVTWGIAPFIHRGVRHIAANMLFIYIAAPVEQRLDKWRYLGLLFLAGYVPLYADGLKLYLFGTEPNIAVMGTSGFGYGMLGFGLASNIGSDWRLTPRWWLIVVLGGIAIVEVVLDIVFGIMDPLSVNLGHLGGLLAGLGLGYLSRSGRHE